MIYYQISPKCTDSTGQKLYLTAQGTTSTVAVAILLPNKDPSQLWTPIEYISDGAHGLVLLNQGTDKVISAPKNDSAVQLTTLSDMKRGTWRFLGDTYGALQLQGNTDMNLNVSGNGPYPSGTAVLAWNWSSGALNELWNFSMI